jgi:hypothetical protein
MICARRESIHNLSDVYLQEYTEAVERLSGIRRQIARDEWELEWELAERARKKSAQILIDLKKHKDAHGC